MDQQFIDNLNRNLGPVISSLQDFQNLLANAKTGTPNPTGSAAKPAMDELKSLMQDFVKDFRKSADEQAAEMKKVVDAMKSVQGSRASQSSSGGSGGSG